jgi:histidinol phosphatase-like enzyme
MTGKVALLVDRDGTLSVDRGWRTGPEDFYWIHEARDEVKWAKDHGIVLAPVITNCCGTRAPGFIDRAHAEWAFDATQSDMIGDAEHALAAAAVGSIRGVRFSAENVLDCVQRGLA